MSDISIQVLPVPTKSEDIEAYRNYALEWKRNGRLEICKEMKAAGMAQKLKQEMAQAIKQFREQTPGCSESMELNFVVKLLFWIDMAAAPVLRAAGGRIYYSGPEKKQEKLFFAMLERSGIVIIRGEMPAPMRVDVRRPERDARTKLSQSQPQNQPQGQPKNFSRTDIRSELRQELSYEKLAQLASSVVKIIVCDSGGRELGCGSGIMIGRGIIADPALFRKALGGPAATKAELRGYLDDLYHGYTELFGSAGCAISRMKGHWFYLIHCFADSEKLEKQLKKLREPWEYETVVNQIFTLPLI